jgi:cardiolipin synthase A/B
MASTEEGVSSTPARRRRLTRGRSLALGFMLAHVLGALTSVHSLMTTRTAPGTVAWIVSLNTFPWAAVPAYWVFGRSRFNGYVVGRRDVDSQLYRSLAPQLDQLREHAVAPALARQSLPVMEALAKLPLLGGNHADLLIDGEATFGSLFEGIAAAQHVLLVQFYIVRDDELGRALKSRLEERARAGVVVHFLYDEIGSYRLPASYIEELRAAGVKASSFQSTRGSGNRFQLNFRNHRKIMVADGRVAWVGGFNVGDEYLVGHGAAGALRDTHLRIEGPAAIALQLSFIEDWHWATDEILDFSWQADPVAGGDMPVMVVPSGPADRFETASLMVHQAVLAARQRIWIASPYFVPDEAVMAALKLAALRGVDVRVLIPEQPDNPLLFFAAYAFVGPLIDAGVKIHRYHDGFLHSKTMLVDDVAAAVGTVNLDNRSFRLNFEITAWVVDAGFARQMARQFEQDFARSRVMKAEDLHNRPWWFRVASRAAYLFAPVL